MYERHSAEGRARRCYAEVCNQLRPCGSGRLRSGPLVGMCEIVVEAGGEQVQRAGEAQALSGSHGVDVVLEPLAPRGSCLRGVPTLPLSRADAARSDLDRQLVQEPAEICGQTSDVIQGDRLPSPAPAARRGAAPGTRARLGYGRPRAAPHRRPAR
jgi:hypothetical protein